MGNTQSTDASAHQHQQQPSAAALAQQQQAERLRRYNGLGQASQPQADDRAPSPSALRRTSTTGSQPVPSASPRTAADRDKAWHRTASLRVRAPSEAGGGALPRNPNARARSGSSAAAAPGGGAAGEAAAQQAAHAASRKSSNASGLLTADNTSLGARRKSIEIMDPDAPTSSHTSSLSRRGAPGTLSPTGFEPHLVVSPYPSPSVAMATQHAAGHPSHQAGAAAPQIISSGMAAIAPTHRAIFNEPPLGGESLGGASGAQGSQVAEPAKDPLGRQLTAALPSYLKIPTLIPSTYASPPGSLASSPTSNDNTRSTGSVTSGDTHAKWMDDSVLGLGPAGAAKAVLNTEDVVIGPGNASKASSPVQRHSPLAPDYSPGEDAHARLSTPANSDAIAAAVAEATGVDELRPLQTTALHGEEEDEEERKGRSPDAVSPSDRAANSRTPTPTPGNSELRTLTPKGDSGMAAMRSHSPSASASGSTVGGGAGDKGSIGRRGGITVVTGIESGLNTPALPPWQAQGAVRSAVRGFEVPASSPSSDSQSTPTRANVNRSGASSARPSPLTPAMGRYLPPTGPLRPVTVTWRGGGREVFVTGTFANEWRSKVPLKRTSKRDHAIVLHLEPGTHRLKFIVDDRWRVSRELPTATDGSGNLVNYIEMPLLDENEGGDKQSEGEAKQKRRSAGALAGHGATMDLKEQARRAEAIRRGDLEEVFGPDKAKEEVWTQEIPAAVIKAQQAEEAYRDACEASPSNAPPPPPSLPAPPLLPRQLSTVLLNASPANPAIAQATGGAIDDLSLLPAPPNSAILHHLTASAIKNGCVAVGTTIRFKKKYVSTLYYSPC